TTWRATTPTASSMRSATSSSPGRRTPTSTTSARCSCSEMDARQQLLAKAQSLLQELSESPDRFDNVARLRSLDSARALFHEAGDGQGEASVLERLASVASNMDDHVAALDYLREAREIAAGLDDA